MDIISLYYFAEVSKDLNITHTANRLYISQQTLSNHIHRLEDYFHAQLLYRKPTLSLTLAGEFVLAFADVMRKEHTNLRDILSDIEQQERGVLRVGASAMQLNLCLPRILPVFSARYPNVEISITDAITSKLEPMVLTGSLDFAITLNGDEQPKIHNDHLMDDQVYLCVSDELLRAHYGDEMERIKEKAIQGAYVEDFSKLPFCLYENRMGQQIHRCFDAANVKPHVYLTSTYTQIGITTCFQQLAACFASQLSLSSQQGNIPGDINIFPLFYHGTPVVQRLSLIRLKDRYLSHYSKYFLDLLGQYFSELEHAHLDRKV